MCLAWVKQWPMKNWGDRNRPFEDVPFVQPMVSYQEGQFECGDILIFFMAKVLMDRGSIRYTNRDFEDNLEKAIRFNKKLHFTQDDMIQQRMNVKASFLMIHSRYALYDMERRTIYLTTSSPTNFLSERQLSEEERQHQSEEETTILSSSVPTESTRPATKRVEFPTTATVTIKTDSAIKTESSRPSSKVATDAKVKKRQRMNKWFNDQLTNLGKLATPLEIEYFDGTYANISWKRAMKMSNLGMVLEYREKGKKVPNEVYGVIAKDKRTGDYFVIAEPCIRRKIQGQVGQYFSDILTGPMKLYGPASTPLVLVQWKNEYKFCLKSKIKYLPQTRERKRKEPDRLQANEVGNLTCLGMTTQIDSNPALMYSGTCPHATMKMYSKYFTDANGGKFSKSPYVNSLVADGQLWLAVDIARDAERPNPDRVTARDSYSEKGKAVHAENTLLLTLMFEITSKRRVSNFEPDAVVKNIRNSTKLTPLDTGKKQIRKSCKHPDCETLSHFAHNGFCSKHKTSKKLCKHCNKGEARCSGGICRSCLKRMFPTQEALRKARLCSVCQCKKSREIGGKCKDCMPEKGKKLKSC